MKIGIFTDLHCGTTSSIMPVYSESKYTARLDMIVKTGKWIAETFKAQGVDIIVNAGDTFDRNVISSEEVTAITEFYSNFMDTRHIVITGNHEILDTQSNFHIANLLSFNPCVEVYNKPVKLDDMISLYPYKKLDSVDFKELQAISNKILFSHIDIAGSHLRQDFITDIGIDKNLLSSMFGIVFNGHLHTHELLETSKNNVVNIGTVSSHSFADSNVYIPHILIFDTDTWKFKSFENPHAILFRRIMANSLDEVIRKLDKIGKKHKLILRVTVPYKIRDDVREYIETNSTVIASRVISSVATNEKILFENTQKFEVKTDIESEFKKFLSWNTDLLNSPIEIYKKVLDEL